MLKEREREKRLKGREREKKEMKGRNEGENDQGIVKGVSSPH
jgi:hypothetical protein